MKTNQFLKFCNAPQFRRHANYIRAALERVREKIPKQLIILHFKQLKRIEMRSEGMALVM